MARFEKKKPAAAQEAAEDEGETAQQTFRRQADGAYAGLQRARQRTFRAFGRRDYTPSDAERAHVANLMEREYQLLIGAVRTGVRVKPGGTSIWAKPAQTQPQEAAPAKPAKGKPKTPAPAEDEEEFEEVEEEER